MKPNIRYEVEAIENEVISIANTEMAEKMFDLLIESSLY